jgi:peptide/nickel transport system permease protein
LIILLTLSVANNIFLESSLTDLGLGTDPQTPNWGGRLSKGRNDDQTSCWIIVVRGITIMPTVQGLNLPGDWLGDQPDPLGRTSRQGGRTARGDRQVVRTN